MTPLLALRRGFDRLTLYLPLLVMAILAMGSWWLVRSMPELWSSPGDRGVRKEPDYHLERFSTQVFDAQGRRTSAVSGDKARHYPETDELHIDHVRFMTVNAAGVALQASALQGIVSGDGERVTLLGKVHVLREAGVDSPSLELWGEHLVALQSQERLVSDKPVEIRRDRDRFTASRLDFDMKSGQYQLDGRVRGTLQARER